LNPRAASWSIPSDPETVSKVRDMAGGTLAEWGLAPPLIDDVELIISELVTNAIRYGGPPITLAIRYEDGSLYGEVADRGSWFMIPAQRKHPDDDITEQGRGLAIVGAYADEWGTKSIDGQTGKAVWFRYSSIEGQSSCGATNVPLG
jgi:anti-sigma regulatory factor (Ser/Thr protein kinase)